MFQKLLATKHYRLRDSKSRPALGRAEVLVSSPTKLKKTRKIVDLNRDGCYNDVLREEPWGRVVSCAIRFIRLKSKILCFRGAVTFMVLLVVEEQENAMSYCKAYQSVY